MDGYRSADMSLPRPGRALKTILIVIATLGILQAILSNWGGTEWLMDSLQYDFARVAHGQIWRLVTSGLLTDPARLGDLIFTVFGLYFLGSDLERRWGAGRFTRFLVAAVLLGNVISFLVSLAAVHFNWSSLPANLTPATAFGAAAAVFAISVAWSLENASATVQLMMIIPVKGRVLLYITLASCVLALIYPKAVEEGALAPIGGILVGLGMAGHPSPLRRFYLQTKLALLRRKGYGLRVEDVMQGQQPPRRGRASKPGAPPLRVVQGGGLEEVLRQRTPPKDKRHLN